MIAPHTHPQEEFPAGKLKPAWELKKANNDGINDAFKVVISEVTRYELDIFNRWGELVFHSEDPDEVWIGNVNGGEHYAPAGMYNYRLKWKGARTDAEEMLGTFELMR